MGYRIAKDSQIQDAIYVGLATTGRVKRAGMRIVEERRRKLGEGGGRNQINHGWSLFQTIRR